MDGRRGCDPGRHGPDGSVSDPNRENESGALYAQVKRFRERWIADDRFRAALLADPEAAVAAAGFLLDPRPLSALWGGRSSLDGPEAAAMRRVETQGRAYFDFCDDDRGAIESYRLWRARQRARSAFAQGVVSAPMSLHLPFAIELTRGCSFGCWFCGVSARPLEAVLPTDLATWERMLGTLHGVFGESAARGVLYWATDPLDHPDYEAHGEVFRRVLGRFPATTTVAALADPARTRRLLALALAGDCPGLRFSVVSRRRFDEITAAFSAEELSDVHLLPLNRESVLALAEAGRARNLKERWPERAAHERRKRRVLGDEERLAHRTIACVSGFLIDPIAGQVRLISPEPASDRWPDGYVVFDEERFGRAEEFERALHRLVERNMTQDMPPRLALQRGVEVRAVARNEVRASGRGHQVRFRSARRDLEHLPGLADAFRDGASVEDAVHGVAARFGTEPRLAHRDSADLWRRGVLIEPVFSLASGAPS